VFGKEILLPKKFPNPYSLGGYGFEEGSYIFGTLVDFRTAIEHSDFFREEQEETFLLFINAIPISSLYFGRSADGEIRR
jgi:hypothetical protein